MPELPEVETIRVGLSRLLPGERVESVQANWPKSFPNAESDVNAFLLGARVTGVRRRAKVLLIDLDTDYTLVTHLKMTGQLVFVGQQERFGAGHPSDSLIGKLPDKSTHVSLHFSSGATLFFNDQRKFGWMRLMPSSEVMNLDFFRSVGPEPLASDFIPKDFTERLARRPKSAIKAVLLDQTVIAGVGNIYADESLWGARIHPESKVANLPPKKIKELYESLRAVLQLSIDKGGSTDHTYVDADGKKGSYLRFASVFRREGQPCPRCGTILVKIRVAGRGTHICPHCQIKY